MNAHLLMFETSLHFVSFLPFDPVIIGQKTSSMGKTSLKYVCSEINRQTIVLNLKSNFRNVLRARFPFYGPCLCVQCFCSSKMFHLRHLLKAQKINLPSTIKLNVIELCLLCQHYSCCKQTTSGTHMSNSLADAFPLPSTTVASILTEKCTDKQHAQLELKHFQLVHDNEEYKSSKIVALICIA